jgi:transposase-like protein
MKKQYSAKFKAQVVLELLREDKSVSQIASEYQVHPTQLHKWRAQAVKDLPSLFADKRKAERKQEAEQTRQVEELYAEIGRLTTRLTWLKKKSGLDYEPR